MGIHMNRGFAWILIAATLVLIGTSSVSAQEVVNNNYAVTPPVVSPYYYPYTSTYYSGPIPGLAGRYGYGYAGRRYYGGGVYHSDGYHVNGYRTGYRSGYRSAGYRSGYSGYRVRGYRR